MMRVVVTNKDGKEEEYVNISYICNAISYEKDKKRVYTMSLVNAVTNEHINIEDTVFFSIYDEDMHWINDNGKRICPRCGTVYPKSIKRDMHYCSICGHKILSSGGKK